MRTWRFRVNFRPAPYCLQATHCSQPCLATLHRKCWISSPGMILISIELGEYTDSEVETLNAVLSDCSSEMSSDDDSYQPTPHQSCSPKKKVAESKENRPPKPSSSEADISYQCPICEKCLRSISGFRGHVIRQHNRADLKGWLKNNK